MFGCKGLSIKDVRSQGGRVLSSADIVWTRKEGVLQMRTPELFGLKKLRIFDIYRVSARTKGEVEPVRTFCEQGGKFFSILCGRLLWMAPNTVIIKFFQMFINFVFTVITVVLRIIILSKQNAFNLFLMNSTSFKLVTFSSKNGFETTLFRGLTPPSDTVIFWWFNFMIAFTITLSGSSVTQNVDNLKINFSSLTAIF